MYVRKPKRVRAWRCGDGQPPLWLTPRIIEAHNPGYLLEAPQEFEDQAIAVGEWAVEFTEGKVLVLTDEAFSEMFEEEVEEPAS